MGISGLIITLIGVGGRLDFNAQTADNQTKQLVAALQMRYGKIAGLKADFQQVYNDPAGRRLREQGQLWLKRPGKMRWEYQKPEEKQFLSDGKKVYFYVPADRQVTITPIKENDDPRLPFIFLLGQINLGRYFKMIKMSPEPPTVAGNVVLEFMPKKVTNTLRTLYAEINPQSLQLQRLVLINGANARSDFVLSNIQENVTLADDLFTFTVPTGVTVLQ
jgi:outer membrane lipoprotein carrier protein